MIKPVYDRKKVRRAMLIAPAVAMLGILPYFLLLNVTFLQFVLAALVALVVCYVAGALLGAPGYLVLRSLGYAQTKYLMAYAALLVLVIALLYRDIYVLPSLGPPVLLAAAAFCLLRGPPSPKAHAA